MNRIDFLFKQKSKNILSVYFTAGYPEINSARQVLRSLQNNGVDMVEIGIPFSDPVADGPIIQESSKIAIRNGMSLSILFDQLKDFREEIEIPVILMGYINPILSYGFDRFCEECEKIGIDGVIIPDLPPDESNIVSPGLLKEKKIHFIQLVTPMTSSERLRYISDISDGFIYVVSSYTTTGSRVISESNAEYFSRLANNTSKPLIVGFGISDRETFESACSVSRGAIIGSAFIKALANSTDIEKTIRDFVTEVRPE